MATMCVNFVCKPENEALNYHVTREQLFHLELCVFGARVLYYENTFAWGANKAVCLVHLLKLFLRNVQFGTPFYFCLKFIDFIQLRNVCLILGTAMANGHLGLVRAGWRGKQLLTDLWNIYKYKHFFCDTVDGLTNLYLEIYWGRRCADVIGFTAP